MPVNPSKSRSKKEPTSTRYQSNGFSLKSSIDKVLNALVYLATHYGRFARDVLGITLLLVSLLTFVALLGLTNGAMLVNLKGLLNIWFGWGSLIVDISLGVLGVLILKRNGSFWQNYFWKLLYFEILLICTLSTLAVISGYDFYSSENGSWGGRIGWGLANSTWLMMGEFLSSAFWILLTILFCWIGYIIYIRHREGTRIEEAFLEPVANPPAEPYPRMAVVTRFDNGVKQAPLPNIPSVNHEKRAFQTKPQPARQIQMGNKAGPLVNLSKETSKAVLPQNEKTGIPAIKINRESHLPPLSVLLEDQVVRLDETTINQTASILEKTLMDFGVPAKVIGYRMGPAVTQFAVEPGFIEKPAPEGQTLKQKVRVAQISQLSRDLALALSATSIRIEAPVSGKTYVGVEIPNVRTVEVRMRSLLESEKFNKVNSPLALALGKDVSGQPVVGDLSRMPHLLIAGTTGSGKTVCMTSLAACLAMNNSPEDLRLIMIDPKMVELVRFNGLPHMYGKVETNLERITGVLRWATQEMDRRYIAFSSIAARDLDNYNQKMEKRGQPVLPRIVIFIDELADLMMNAQASVEPLIVRLAQLARATGIHLIVATQRPSTTVVTGLIKANFPARISFAVASQIDSRVILDMNGAESLLGRGDMLFLDPEKSSPIRTQGVMISDAEVERIIEHWKNEQQDTLNTAPPWENMLFEEKENPVDELLQHAIRVIKETRQVNASLFQRKLHIGYPRAARLIEELEEMQIIGPVRPGGKDREILIDLDESDSSLQD